MITHSFAQVGGTVARRCGKYLAATGEALDKIGYVNQHGLSRKV
jgi:hypothetical protein